MILAALTIALVALAGQEVPEAAPILETYATAGRAYSLDAIAAKGIAQAIAEAPAKGTMAPRALWTPIPNDFYPPAALRAEQQGLVQLRCRLAVTGRLEDCTVARSSGFPLLDAASFEVAKHSRVCPRIVDRVPEAGDVVLPVRWMIQ